MMAHKSGFSKNHTNSIFEFQNPKLCVANSKTQIFSFTVQISII